MRLRVARIHAAAVGRIGKALEGQFEPIVERIQFGQKMLLAQFQLLDSFLRDDVIHRQRDRSGWVERPISWRPGGTQYPIGGP